MTNRFHLSMDSWGTKLVALAMFAFLATNTWHFISTFIPNDTWYHRPAMFVFFEGGLLYWFNRLEHASENVGKTIVAALMTLIQLAAVGFATLYELSVGFQQMLHIRMDTTIQQDMPFVVSGLIIVWIIAWALGRLFNHHFAARIGYIARNGIAPHIDGVDVAMLTPDGVPALASGRTRGQRALPDPRSRGASGTQAASSVHTGQDGRARAMNVLSAVQALFNPKSRGVVESTVEPPDAMQDACTDDAEPDTDKVPAQKGQQQNSMSARPINARRKPASRATNSARTATRSRTGGNMQEIIEIMVEKYPDADNAEIAQRVGCASSTVSRWRAANVSQAVQA